MSDEVREEPTTDDSEEDAIEELTIEERQEALKRARWNVFMYLGLAALLFGCLLYTSPSPRDMRRSRMPSSA